MRLAAQQNRVQGTASRQQMQQQHLAQEMRLRQQEEEEQRYLLELARQNREPDVRRQFYEQDPRVTEHDQRLLEQEQRRILLEQEQRRMLLEQERRILIEHERERQLELERQQLIQLQQQEQQRLQLQRLMQQQLQQRTPPPRMLPVSQSPRFFEHQRQLLQLQQQQQQEQLQMEELQRQLASNLSLQQGVNNDPRRRLAGPTDYEIQAAQLLQQQQQQQRRQRSQSPALNQFNGAPQDLAPQNIQLQQRLLSEMAQAEFMREIQSATPKQLEQQEALRMEAMRKILEAEKMEEKRRRKAAKIAHMVFQITFHLLQMLIESNYSPVTTIL